MEDFYHLIVWKKCREFKKAITEIVKKFPRSEQYRLVDQAIRSARSITANLAEGHGRFHFQENIQFCRQARGSLSETLNHMIDAFDENYIGREELLTLKGIYNECIRLVNGYISYLKKCKNQLG